MFKKKSKRRKALKLQSLTIISGLILSFAVAENASAQGKKNLTFAQYAALKMTGKVAAVNLKSHPQANDFRTRLREAASAGVNFAVSCGLADRFKAASNTNADVAATPTPTVSTTPAASSSGKELKKP